MNILIANDRAYLFTDATVNIEPTAEELADIAAWPPISPACWTWIPRVAMLSFSNSAASAIPPRKR